MQECLEVIRTTGAHTLDLTGGAPEMNPDFRWFVEEAAKAGAQVVQEPEAMPWGQTTAYVADKNGFLIEICTPVDA